MGAWEESWESCPIKSTEDCEHDFWSKEGTTDAICQCGKYVEGRVPLLMSYHSYFLDDSFHALQLLIVLIVQIALLICSWTTYHPEPPYFFPLLSATYRAQVV